MKAISFSQKNYMFLNYIVRTFVVFFGIHTVSYRLAQDMIVPGSFDFYRFFASYGFTDSFIIGISYYFFYSYQVKKSNPKWNSFMVISFMILSVMQTFNLLEYNLIYGEEDLWYIEYFYYSFLRLFGECFSLFLLLYFMHNSEEILNSSEEKEIQTLKTTQAALLRHKFNPHFLFNTFNILYFMASVKDPKTSETIQKVSNIMEYLTKDIKEHKIPLEREVNFIKQYISIGELRFSERVSISFNIKGNTKDIYIEPMILMNLIENAFKHGSFKGVKESYIKIVLEIREDKRLLFFVKNSKSKQVKYQLHQRESKGLFYLKERLNLIYPDKFEISLLDQGDHYYASILLYLNEMN